MAFTAWIQHVVVLQGGGVRLVPQLKGGISLGHPVALRGVKLAKSVLCSPKNCFLFLSIFGGAPEVSQRFDDRVLTLDLNSINYVTPCSSGKCHYYGWRREYYLGFPSSSHFTTVRASFAWAHFFALLILGRVLQCYIFLLSCKIHMFSLIDKWLPPPLPFFSHAWRSSPK